MSLSQGLRKAIYLLPALLCLGTVLSAQERFGELTGTATDPSGAVLPNVNLKVTNKATARVVETTTDSSGQYVLRNLDPGRYKARFEVKGFAPLEVPEGFLKFRIYL